MPDTVTRYEAAEGFEVVSWYEEFWQDESDSVMSHMTFEEFMQLCILDFRLLDKHAEEKTNYLDISKTCLELGGMMLLARRRTLHLEFPCTEGVCAFIAQLSDTPARAVMYCTALALAWEQRFPDMISTLIGDSCYADIPSMNWIANMFNSGFVVGEKSPEGPMWLETDMWGIPGADHMRRMWEKQKRTARKPHESDNFLDTVRVKSMVVHHA